MKLWLFAIQFMMLGGHFQSAIQVITITHDHRMWKLSLGGMGGTKNEKFWVKGLTPSTSSDFTHLFTAYEIFCYFS